MCVVFIMSKLIEKVLGLANKPSQIDILQGNLEPDSQALLAHMSQIHAYVSSIHVMLAGHAVRLITHS